MPHHKYDVSVIRSGYYTDAQFARKIWGEDIVHVQEICRQQILGDRELLRDIDAGRETELDRGLVVDRLFFVERVAHLAGLELPPLPLDEGRDILADLAQVV